MLNLADLTELEFEEILLIYIARNFKNYDAVHNGIGLEPYHFTLYPSTAAALFEQCEANQKDTEKTIEWFRVYCRPMWSRWSVVETDNPLQELYDLFRVTKRVLIAFFERVYATIERYHDEAEDEAEKEHILHEMQRLENKANMTISICNKMIYGPLSEYGEPVETGERGDIYVATIQRKY